MKVEEINVIKLTESVINENKEENESLSTSKIIMEKSSDYKDQIIELKNKDTVFKFESNVEGEYLSIKLSEVDAVAPYFYIVYLTLDKMKEIHKMFRSCDDLEEVKIHIDKLFEEHKIKLEQQKPEEIILNFKAFFISKEDDFQIFAERKIVDNKNSMLLKLYEIQKNKIKMLKEIEEFIKDNDFSKNQILEKIKAIKEKYES